MSIVPTPEEFLTTYEQPDEPEEIELEPLESIADSLRCLVAVMKPQEGIVLPTDYETVSDEYAPAVLEEASKQAAEEDRDDWEDKHRALSELVMAISAIVKPSTSKVSLEVKAAIERWTNPQPEPAEETSGSEPLDQPAHDAPVEEWRAYARSYGYTGYDVDKCNRSQIRTMLGIEQPMDAES